MARILIRDIQAKVCETYQMPLRIMEERGHRWASDNHPRQVAMYLSRRLTRHSLRMIGGRFGGRDHSSVWHAFNKLESLRKSDPSLDATLAQLEQGLGGVSEL